MDVSMVMAIEVSDATAIAPSPHRRGDFNIDCVEFIETWHKQLGK
jgi:hypothetical protein